MPKTSDFGSRQGAAGLRRPKLLSLSRVARGLGRSQRAIREWCKKGQIPEAYKTRGGHWRIRMPLSAKTRFLLNTRASDWPFKKFGKNGDFQGDWNPEFAEWLMIAQVYQQRLGEPFPVPTIAEQGDPWWEDIIEQSTDPRVRKVRKIQEEILRRIQNDESFSDLLLIGWVYQFWHENGRRPTVSEIAELMGQSRDTFYRRYTRAELYRALRVASGRVEAHLPDPEGLDSAQRANKKAKKRTIDRDPYADD